MPQIELIFPNKNKSERRFAIDEDEDMQLNEEEVDRTTFNRLDTFDDNQLITVNTVNDPGKQIDSDLDDPFFQVTRNSMTISKTTTLRKSRSFAE